MVFNDLSNERWILTCVNGMQRWMANIASQPWINFVPTNDFGNHSSIKDFELTIVSNPLCNDNKTAIVAFYQPSTSCIKAWVVNPKLHLLLFPRCWSLCDCAGHFGVAIHLFSVLHAGFSVVVCSICCLSKFSPSSSLYIFFCQQNWTLASVNLSSGVSMVDLQSF